MKVQNVILQEELEHSTNEDLKVKFERGYQLFRLQVEIPKKYIGLWGIAIKLWWHFPRHIIWKTFRFSSVSNLLTKTQLDWISQNAKILSYFQQNWSQILTVGCWSIKYIPLTKIMTVSWLSLYKLRFIFQCLILFIL